jgi:FlaA1/EpsC-like NDP-sugar epimerase
MEECPQEAVKNNVMGTYTMARLADKYMVYKFVLISTDKAVNPTSVMGYTKKLTELCLLNLFKSDTTKFIIVRFGNVLGSEGSVVPIFKRQIEKGRALTVTHPEMRRFFMTIPEAVSLALEASYIGQHKDILVLNMGEQIKILDIAENLIKLSGLKPYEDIQIKFTGIGSGEKMNEELWDQSEEPMKTHHPKIFKLAYNEKNIKFKIETFKEVIEYSLKHESAIQICERLKTLVPTYQYNKVKDKTA